MIPEGVDVYVATEPDDMRYGFERLSGLVRERMGREPRSRAFSASSATSCATSDHALWWASSLERSDAGGRVCLAGAVLCGFCGN